jgi:antitoxin component YwqK of YwqJK toxin-antitoxin module
MGMRNNVRNFVILFCLVVLSNHAFSAFKCLQYSHSKIFLDENENVVSEWIYPDGNLRPLKFGEKISGDVIITIMSGSDKGTTQKVNLISDLKQDGEYYWMYPDGSTHYAENCADNSVNGERKEFYPTGEIKYSAGFIKSMPDGKVNVYAKNGLLLETSNYREGKRNGVCVFMVFDCYQAKMEVRCNYKEDRKDGTFEIYDPNGMLMLKGNYKDDKPDGDFQLFDSGNLINIIKADKFDEFFKKNRINFFFPGKIFGVQE